MYGALRRIMCNLWELSLIALNAKTHYDRGLLQIIDNNNFIFTVFFSFTTAHPDYSGITWHNNQKSQLPFDVAVAEQSAPLYENGEFIPGWKAWSGKSVAVLGSAI